MNLPTAQTAASTTQVAAPIRPRQPVSSKQIMVPRAKTTNRSNEYRNLRHIVPSLRRQRDVDKVEVVTEAARYIDHLHKTLIERFVLCGIPSSLKDILGTDNANELGAQHIMNLVTSMAAAQRQAEQRQQLAREQQLQRRNLTRQPVLSQHSPAQLHHTNLLHPAAHLSHRHLGQKATRFAQISARQLDKCRRLRRGRLGKKVALSNGSALASIASVRWQQRAPIQVSRIERRPQSPEDELKKKKKQAR